MIQKRVIQEEHLPPKGKVVGKCLSRERNTRLADSANRSDPLVSAMRYEFARARQRAEIEAQHGPVKVLVKDGKPV